jgi:hypothetical protein
MTMLIEIKHRYTGAILYSTDVADNDPRPMRTALERAVAADANLARANLAGADLAGANLAGADLAGANLARANLAGADLADAYLAGADLADADLADANLAGAWNVPIGTDQADPPEPYQRATTDEEREARRLARMTRYRERHPDVPIVENLDRRILEVVDSGTGSLDMSQWHSCATTHCRAGWAITLAGEKGAELEREHGPHRAGAMIYRASTGRVPHFFATNERALEDMRRCTEETETP